MKNYVLGVITTCVLVGMTWGAYKYRSSTHSLPTQGVVTATAIPTEPVAHNERKEVTPTPEEDVAVRIKEALIKKNNWKNGNDLIVTVKTNDGTYASGGIKEQNAEAGGGYFFAVKDKGEWVIVADGNGTMSCASIAPYPNYPTTLIPECWDEQTNTLITR